MLLVIQRQSFQIDFQIESIALSLGRKKRVPPLAHLEGRDGVALLFVEVL